MASAPTFEIDPLLAPVSDEQPAGPALRSSGNADQETFYAVRDARKKASVAERRGRSYALLTEEERQLEPSAPDPPDWRAVRDLSAEALTKSKDLWIAAWFIEALVRLDGFAGLRDGFRLAHQLCDRFWPSVHPQPDEDEDLSVTFAQLAGLNGADAEGTLIAPILGVPITSPNASGQYSCADYKDATELDRKEPKVRSQRVEPGAATTDMIDRAVAETDLGFFENLLEDMQEARQAFDDLNAAFGQKVADLDDGSSYLPPSSSIEEALDECQRLLTGLTRNIMPGSEEEKKVEADETPGATSTPGETGRVRTRDEAFRRLLEVSDYFRRTEPHSPVSYALEQVVRWGRMSLPQLLAELIKDDSTRREVFTRTGIEEDE